MEKFEKESASEKLSSFMLKNRKIILALSACVIVAVVAVCLYIALSQRASQKAISEIEKIEYELTDNSFSLSEEELAERKKIAKEKLGQYLSKSGIVGVRSNMIAADLAFSERDFENAKSYWITAASKGKNSYTAALAYFNVAVCAEELNDLDTAISYYSRSADFTDFYLSPHARFSEGRVYEQKNDYANAKKAYTALVDSKPNDTWANLAKTRLLSLDIEGKVN
ncbi:MAG: tetratricopeptide repeat protein [Treponema sp.]|nr:tetratricopeptide repeat protein [Treponema sp.]